MEVNIGDRIIRYNKKDLEAYIAMRNDIPVCKSSEIVGDVLQFIISILKQGNEISLPPLGIFKIKSTKGYSGRTVYNPKAQKEITSPDGKPYNIIKFLPYKKLKDSLKEKTWGCPRKEYLKDCDLEDILKETEEDD